MRDAPYLLGLLPAPGEWPALFCSLGIDHSARGWVPSPGEEGAQSRDPQPSAGRATVGPQQVGQEGSQRDGLLRGGEDKGRGLWGVNGHQGPGPGEGGTSMARGPRHVSAGTGGGGDGAGVLPPPAARPEHQSCYTHLRRF